ncbi:MAG TPA: ECF transporter S component [Clostridiales bacterium UBA8153]|nr:ECF transporter S component [Clostridiales bacterium UBA8153]
MLVALTLVATTLLRVPSPGGELCFHFGTAVIFTTALLLGARMGAVVGALGSALADIILGLWVWFPVSFFIHGMEGYLVGSVATGRGNARVVQALLVGSVWTVAAYAVAVGLVYGWAAVPLGIAGDVTQVGVGAVVAWFLVAGLRRAYPMGVGSRRR